MAKPLTAETKARLGKLVLLLASDQMGEVNAAAAAIRRTLKAAGVDLHDFAGAITSPGGATKVQYVPVPGPPVIKEKIVYRDRIKEKVVEKIVEKIVYRDRIVHEAQPQQAVQPAPKSEYEQADPKEWHYVRVWKLSGALLQYHIKHDVLTGTELRFVEQMNVRAQQYGKRFLISVKQVNWLLSMAERFIGGEP